MNQLVCESFSRVVFAAPRLYPHQSAFSFVVRFRLIGEVGYVWLSGESMVIVSAVESITLKVSDVRFWLPALSFLPNP